MGAVGAVVGGVASLAGGLIGGNAAQSAANTEANAENNATALQSQEFQTEQANMAPYLASGQANLATLNADMPQLTSQFTMQDFQNSPGYQFQLNQGLLAGSRSAAAAGMLDSSGTQQNAAGYAEGLANTDYQQALTNFTNNQQQRYNMLAGLAGQGLQATGMSNQAAQTYGSQVGQNMTGLANAQAAGTVGTANAITGGINNLANGYMGYSSMNNLANSIQNLNNPPVPGYQLPQLGSNLAQPAASSDPLGIGQLSF